MLNTANIQLKLKYFFDNPPKMINVIAVENGNTDGSSKVSRCRLASTLSHIT